MTNKAVNLFGNVSPEAATITDLGDGIYVIPTGERVRMTIVYDVETKVDRLPGLLSDGSTHGTSIENRITTDLVKGSDALTFEGGRSYTIKLHLGMNSIKLDAAVNDTWENITDILTPPLP